jgi:hypothetical protein
MLSFYADLLVRAFLTIPPLLGGNMLGLVWPIIIVLCGEVIACIAYGWRTVKAKWKQASLMGLVSLVVCYTGLFAWCIFAVNYQDHVVLASRAAYLQQAFDEKDAHEKIAVLLAKSKCAEVLGENKTLGQQNRDQQNSINNCQTEAIKMLTPAEQKTQVRLIAPRDDDFGLYRKYEVLLLTNKPVFPTLIQVVCRRTIISIEQSLLSRNGPTIITQPKKLSAMQYELGITSPPWTAENPVLIKLTLDGQGNSRELPCVFQGV